MGLMAGMIGACSGFGAVVMANATRKMPLSRGEPVPFASCPHAAINHTSIPNTAVLSRRERTLESCYVHHFRLLGWELLCQDREDFDSRCQRNPC
jgi:hypothetical protein